MGYRVFSLKIVPDNAPNDDGRWIERVVPDVWPGDSPTRRHMLRHVPSFDTIPVDGYHIVQIEEHKPGPSNQPVSMHEMLARKIFEEREAFKAGDNHDEDFDTCSPGYR